MNRLFSDIKPRRKFLLVSAMLLTISMILIIFLSNFTGLFTYDDVTVNTLILNTTYDSSVVVPLAISGPITSLKLSGKYVGTFSLWLNNSGELSLIARSSNSNNNLLTGLVVDDVINDVIVDGVDVVDGATVVVTDDSVVDVINTTVDTVDVVTPDSVVDVTNTTADSVVDVTNTTADAVVDVIVDTVDVVTADSVVNVTDTTADSVVDVVAADSLDTLVDVINDTVVGAGDSISEDDLITNLSSIIFEDNVSEDVIGISDFDDVTLVTNVSENIGINDSLVDLVNDSVLIDSSEFVSLDSVCVDTCLISVNLSDASLVLVLSDNSSLSLDSVSYTVPVLKSPVLFVNNISDVVTFNGSVSFNLSEYFVGSDLSFDSIAVVGVNYVISDDIISFDILSFGNYSVMVYASDGFDVVESNIFNVNYVFSDSPVITLVQLDAVVGRNVSWVKSVDLNNAKQVVVDIPFDSDDVFIDKVVLGKRFKSVAVVDSNIDDVESDDVESDDVFVDLNLLDNVSLDDVDSSIISLNDSVLNDSVLDKRVVSKIVSKSSKNISKDVSRNISKNNFKFVNLSSTESSKYEISYTTPAPVAVEEIVGDFKRVHISSPDGLHYVNVTSYTNLLVGVKSADSVKVLWVEENIFVPVSDILDLDNDGLFDYVEWISPHLSNQTFDIIVITQAEHLDENRTIISDIYSEVVSLDGVWSESINANEFVRVVFESNLTSRNDITLFPRIISGNPVIEVYVSDGVDVVARLDVVDSNYYNKIYLTDLYSSQDSFDLRIVGGVVEFDHIIDPTCVGGVCVELFTANNSWIVPLGVSNISVEAWGAGGAGGAQNLTSDGGGGGGGGAYSRSSFVVVNGTNYSIVVGSKGISVRGNNGTSGGDSWFNNTATLLAKGGRGGARSTGTPPVGGLGGNASLGNGSVKYSGGQGEKGINNNNGNGGGYGGSSAGNASNGYSGPQTWANSTYPTASTPIGAYHGGDGGPLIGTNGSSPVSGYGGGGGGSGEGLNMYAGNGSSGLVKITYTSPITVASRISPTVAYNDDTLIGYCNATNLAGYNLTYSYSWFRNGAVNLTGVTSRNYSSGLEINVVNISSTWTSTGDTWTLSCMASDVLSNSSWVNSSVYISVIPVVNSVSILPYGANRSNNLFGYCNATIVGNYSLSYKFNWSVDSVEKKSGWLFREGSVSVGGAHSCVVLVNGSVACWGYNHVSQVGAGGNMGIGGIDYPVLVNSSAQFVSVSAGAAHSCGVLVNGSVMCWGYDTYGQLGDGSNNSDKSSPVLVNSSAQFVSVSAGGGHSCGVLVNGSVMCWGVDGYSQLGDGGVNANADSPVFVNSSAQFVSISLGDGHSCGVLVNGSVMCWGSDQYGQLGDGSNNSDKSSPVLVNSSAQFVSVSLGNSHSCGLLLNGSVMCWGYDHRDQLGYDEIMAQMDSPVFVNSSAQFVSVSAGGSHSCGLLLNGSVMCWGDNVNGQVGDGTNTSGKFFPVLINSSAQFVSVDGGEATSCGLLLNGSVMCWGLDDLGQLGDGGSNSSMSSPVKTNTTWINGIGYYPSFSTFGPKQPYVSNGRNISVSVLSGTETSSAYYVNLSCMAQSGSNSLILTTGLLFPVLCANLTTANSVVTLSSNLSSSGICFNVSAANVTIDCAGFSIVGSNSANSYGVYSNKFNTTVKNCKIINYTNAMRFDGATSGFIFNNTFISSSNTLVYLNSSSSNNVLCLNNFTNTSSYYVNDLNGSNYYNCSYSSKNQGNVWYNVLNGSVSVYGNESSTVSGLYLGTLGTGYPYNFSTSLGKLNGSITDYAPITATPYLISLLIVDPSSSTPRTVSVGENGSIYFYFLVNGVNITSGVSVSSIYVGNVSIVSTSSIFSADNYTFEEVTFPPENWTTGGDNNWHRNTTSPLSGSASAQSGVIGDNQASWLKTQTINFTSNGSINFSWKVGSEGSWDFLLFCIDANYGDSGCTRGAATANESISGTTSGNINKFISAGTHFFTWAYAKDGSGNVSPDAGNVDNISIYYNHTIAGFTPVYVAGQGWRLNITMPNLTGYQNIAINATYSNNSASDIESNALYFDFFTCRNLNTSGIYALTADLQSNVTCFNVTVANVIIDCAGYSILGNNSANSYGVYSTKVNTTIKNCKIINFTNAIRLDGAINGTIFNNTFISSSNTLVYLNSTSSKNIFCLNNFTNTSGLYVNDTSTSNYYNCSYASKNQGNLWHNLINGSITIGGNESSSISGYYLGNSGSGYPYNGSNSQNKVSSVVFDYAPLTSLYLGPPIIISSRIYPTNPSDNDNLLGYCNASDTIGTNLTYYYRWYKNAVLNISGLTSINYSQSIEYNIINLSNTSTSNGQIWMFSCLATDGVYNSSWINSSSVGIGNGPIINSVSISPAGANRSNNLFGYCNATITGNSSLSYFFNWTIDGVENKSGWLFREGSISVGVYYSCGVLLNGSVMCWGRDDYGQLGNGGSIPGTDVSSPVFVNSSAQFVSVSAGFHSCGVLVNGSVMCWGRDDYGQLGNGGSIPGTDVSSPVFVNSSAQFVSVSVGAFHSCGVLLNGSVMCWGRDDYGQLGNGGTNTAMSSPVFVNSSAQFVSVSVGALYSCGVLLNGSVMCWGSDANGNLGNGGSIPGTDVSSPVFVNSSNIFVSVDLGSSASCGVLVNGSVMCWGFDFADQLGDGGADADKSSPVFVNSSAQFVSVSVGSHSCGVLVNGSAMCWGDDSYGQVGDGNAAIRTGPVFVNSSAQFVSVSASAGGSHSCGLLVNGSVSCWGYDYYGQLGNGGSLPGTDTTSPVTFTNTTSLTGLGSYPSFSAFGPRQPYVSNGRDIFVSVLSGNKTSSANYVNLSCMANSGSYNSSTLTTGLLFPVICTNLTTANSVVTLSNNLSSSGTCFNVSAQNVTVDCAGFSIVGRNTSNSYGVYSTTFNTTVKNCIISNFTNAIRFDGATNGTILNNTLLPDIAKANILIYLNGTASKNVFCLNNFTNTSRLYVNDTNSSNYYNCTFASMNQGNVWYNVINGSVNITGSVSSSIGGLFIGTAGVGYPYNSSTSLNKVSVGVIDYAPLTSQQAASNSAPIINTSRISPTIAYNIDTLIGYCNATDADNNNLSYYYSWFRNGIENLTGITSSNYTAGLEINVVNISSDWTSVGDNWTLSCLASDGLLNSSWLNSSVRFINDSNSAPIITAVVSISPVDPIESSQKIINVNFTVTDDQGNSTINVSSAKVIVNNSLVSRQSTGCSAIEINLTSLNVSCNVSLQYYDSAGVWNINISIKDTSGLYIENLTTSFTYNTLYAISLNTNLLDFGSVNAGAENISAGQLILNNTGNYNYTLIQLKAFDLINDSYVLNTSNFRINISNMSIGDVLDNGTFINITAAKLLKSTDSSVGNQSMYVYIDIPFGTAAKKFSALSDWILKLS